MKETKQPMKGSNKGSEESGGRGSRLFLWIIMVVATLFLFFQLLNQKESKDFIGYDEILDRIRQGKVKQVIAYQQALDKSEIKVVFFEKDKAPLQFKSPDREDYEKQLREAVKAARAQNPNVETYQAKEPPFTFTSLLPYLPAILLVILFFFLFTRLFRAPGGTGSVLSFGKSRARLVNKEKSRVTFEDVAGIEEAKDEVSEIIQFLKNPEKFQRLGGRVPRGVILVGPSGTGKTLLAKAIAGEADVPFFSICGSDFVEMFVGVGASRVRDLFKQARDNSPCILFLDEVDAVGRKRGSGLGGGHDEREQTLNAILVEMDGFESDEGIIVIASTNRPDVLDPALLRPGRFDREIVIDLPDVRGREAILQVHLRKVKKADDLNVQQIARLTPTFSGAELEAIVNEAAIRAAMKEQDCVTTANLEEARDKVRWGREKKSMVITDEDRRITAVHEAGHALVAYLLPEVEPLHKVTIIPRGMALGATMQLPEGDRYHMMKKQILGDVSVCYAGRCAEVLFCDDITSGAKQDIARATKLLRLLVCEFGMSDNLGLISYHDTEEHLFLGRELSKTHENSEKLNEEIDREVRKLSDMCYQKTMNLLKQERRAVQEIAERLLEKESLTSGEVGEIIHSLNDGTGEAGASAGQQPTQSDTGGEGSEPGGREDAETSPPAVEVSGEQDGASEPSVPEGRDAQAKEGG